MKQFTLLFLFFTLTSTQFGFAQDIECGSVTSNTPVATLDNDIEVTATIDITDEYSLTSMSMDIEITHTFIGDVKFNLMSPAGTTLIISQGQCSDGQNMDATYTDDGMQVMCNDGIPAVQGDILPFSAFSNLNGQNSAGTWTLIVTDTGPGDTGTITSWTLNYCGMPALGVDDFKEFENLTIAPNPVQNELSVALNQNFDEPISIQIINILGQTVKKLTTLQNVTIPVDDLSSGIYLINFSTNQSKTSRRFVVE